MNQILSNFLKMLFSLQTNFYQKSNGHGDLNSPAYSSCQGHKLGAPYVKFTDIIVPISQVTKNLPTDHRHKPYHSGINSRSMWCADYGVRTTLLGATAYTSRTSIHCKEVSSYFLRVCHLSLYVLQQRKISTLMTQLF